MDTSTETTTPAPTATVTSAEMEFVQTGDLKINYLDLGPQQQLDLLSAVLEQLADAITHCVGFVTIDTIRQSDYQMPGDWSPRASFEGLAQLNTQFKDLTAAREVLPLCEVNLPRQESLYYRRWHAVRRAERLPGNPTRRGGRPMAGVANARKPHQPPRDKLSQCLTDGRRA